MGDVGIVVEASCCCGCFGEEQLILENRQCLQIQHAKQCYVMQYSIMAVRAALLVWDCNTTTKQNPPS
jgi:hypothetical protein